ncbi:MAG: hypothetical protein PVI23_10090 [Maricaulaceae bacterium]|jgi:hypothetical protein
MKRLLACTALVAAFAAASCTTTAEEEMPDMPVETGPTMSFFVTGSPPPNGGNLGGLAGADAMCRSMAAEVGAGDRDWRAYLSTEATLTAPAIHARNRIGTGPWYNADGVMVASNLAQLHNPSANNLNKETVLTQHGEQLNGRGDTPNRHDVITGSFSDGTLYIQKDVLSATCRNWTDGQDSTGVVTRVGHHDRQGGGDDPTSWNSAHNSRGCALDTLRSTGGDGRFYCFAAD